MNKTISVLIFSLITFSSASLYAEEKVAAEQDNTRVLTEEELESKIGRFGEVEEIPEDFEFNPAEVKLWMTHY